MPRTAPARDIATPASPRASPRSNARHDPRVAPGSPASTAIPVLLERHGPMLHALATRLCGHRDDADDLVQDVFVQALRKWGTFRGEADPGTWLYSIAARLCRARHRRRGGVDRRTPAMSQLMPWGESTVMHAVVEGGVESEVQRREAVERVRASIAGLPDHLRLVVVFKEVLGLSVSDTARALRLQENTVKTRLLRARLALRKAMTAAAAPAPAPPPIFDKRVCLDLLQAKMDAMDRGGHAAGFAVPRAEMCARCRAVFREFDLVQDACAELEAPSLSPALRDRIRAAIDSASASNPPQPSRRGRRPVGGSRSPVSPRAQRPRAR